MRRIDKILRLAFYSLIIAGMAALILFFLFWLPILEWFCSFKTWC